ncbi:unnamed protein product [Rhizoctonia solani]|uniref:DUF6533 domain-containing protein n=1 Tax=Rhizoctonia solani TaxID=456999 RepID=A0A8H3CAE4_9AGAM|nr:unnamed protein product [Rhizoctonia solani]
MPATPYSPELLANMETAMHDVRLCIVLSVVGFALLIYDHLLTFADEVQYIWKTKKSPVVIMFLLNRYITPIVLAIDLYDKGGIATYSSHTFCVTCYAGKSRVIVFDRHADYMHHQVMAIWGRPRWIVVLLCSLWLAYFCTTLGILLASLFTKAHTVHFEPLLKVCYLTIAPFLWGCWVPPLILEIVLFGLLCVQAFQAGKFTARMPIIHVLFRDGALHFAVIFACSVFNMITWIVAPPTLVALAKYFGIAMVNVMISRLVLNLRSCRADSRTQHFVITPGGGIQVHISVDEVELGGATWKSKDRDQELDAEAASRAGASPSRSVFNF